MSKQMIAVLKGDKIVEIIERKRGKKIVRDCERLVDLSARPDLTVGATWPFSPQPDPRTQE
jgi:hypothetical protein